MPGGLCLFLGGSVFRQIRHFRNSVALAQNNFSAVFILNTLIGMFLITEWED